jgi:exopolysaccharide biosynthesis polyprenyl glycosylphosphotransferase
MNTHFKEKAIKLFLSDGLAMFVAFVLAIAFGHKASFSFRLVLHYESGFLTLIISTIILFFIIDVYSLNKIPDRFMHQVLYIGFGLIAGAILSTFFFFFSRDAVPRAVFLLFYLFSFILITYFRYRISLRTLSTIDWRVLIVGSQERSAEIARLIKARRYLRSRVVGYAFDNPGMENTVDVPHLGDHRDLVQIVDRHNINYVIVAGHRISESVMRPLLECMQKKIKVSDFRKVIEDITGKVPIEHLTDNWFVVQLSDADKRYFWYFKRSFDIVVGLFGLLLASPVLALAALLIKLDSKGPVLYSQQRIGRENVPFRVWKLRTMVADADKDNVHWTLDNDNRITRVGGLLRKIHIDEIPQLYNILKGEMSLIGPRPEAMSLVERYAREIPYYPERHMVTPGITGWAQINHPYGNSIEDTREKLMYDFYYLKNRSITLDMTIFLRTIRIVLTGKGAL